MGRRKNFGEEREEFIQRSKREWSPFARSWWPRHPATSSYSREERYIRPLLILTVVAVLVLVVGPLLFITLSQG